MFRSNIASLVALSLAFSASHAVAQQASFGSSSLLPLPSVYRPVQAQPTKLAQSASYPVRQAATVPAPYAPSAYVQNGPTLAHPRYQSVGQPVYNHNYGGTNRVGVVPYPTAAAVGNRAWAKPTHSSGLPMVGQGYAQPTLQPQLAAAPPQYAVPPHVQPQPYVSAPVANFGAASPQYQSPRPRLVNRSFIHPNTITPGTAVHNFELPALQDATPTPAPYDQTGTVAMNAGAYADAMATPSWDAAYGGPGNGGSCASGDCGYGGSCGGGDCGNGGFGPGCLPGGSLFSRGCGPVWIGTLGGLFMSRDRPNPVWLSFNNLNVNTNLLSTQDVAGDDFLGGFEVRFGRRIGASAFLEATYWTLDVNDESQTISSPSNVLNTTLTVSTVTLGNRTLDAFFDNASTHSIKRRNEFHNLEINLFSAVPIYNSGQRWTFNWLTGVRYFRFDESLLFSSSSANNNFQSAGGTESAFYQIDVQNNLVGWQIGGQADFRLSQRFRLFAAPIVGIYGNDIKHRSRVLRGDGLAAFNISSSKVDVATLAQLDIGASYAFTRWINGYVGYRIVSVSGVALSDSQIPSNLADAAGITQIDSNGHLLLHGLTGGVQFTW